MDELQYVRVFPLSLVLFPGVSVPLHIFEERYKTMVGECIEGREPFGIVLARDEQASEEALPEQPHSVGTLAYISAVEKLEEGKMNIVVEGRERFRIIELVAGRPYMGANVELLEAQVPEGIDESALKKEVVALFSDYITRLVGLAGQTLNHLELPDDPETLSCTVAAMLAIPLEERQELLEELNVRRTLERELDLLQGQIELLDRAAASQNTAVPLDPERYRKFTSLN